MRSTTSSGHRVQVDERLAEVRRGRRGDAPAVQQHQGRLEPRPRRGTVDAPEEKLLPGGSFRPPRFWRQRAQQLPPWSGRRALDSSRVITARGAGLGIDALDVRARDFDAFLGLGLRQRPAPRQATRSSVLAPMAAAQGGTKPLSFICFMNAPDFGGGTGGLAASWTDFLWVREQ